jgi:hypothetical protein
VPAVEAIGVASERVSAAGEELPDILITRYLEYSLPYRLILGAAVLPAPEASIRIAALAGVQPHEAGLASGLINTSQQIGGALGVAIAATVAFTHTTTLLHTGHALAEAQTSGFALGFWVIAGFAAAAVVATLALIRSQEVATEASVVTAL